MLDVFYGVMNGKSSKARIKIFSAYHLDNNSYGARLK